MRLDPFYPIFDSSEWLEKLLPLGIKLVQLRIKEKSEQETRDEIRKSLLLCEKYGCQLIVNDYWHFAMDSGCDFVHLGQEDINDADIELLTKAKIKIGISTHSEQELDRALDFAPSYIALGPVYPTILKKMPWSPQGLDRVTEWKHRVGNLPLVGIGGVNLERAQGILDAGADSVAMVTDITLNSDPVSQVERWIELTEPYRFP